MVQQPQYGTYGDTMSTTHWPTYQAWRNMRQRCYNSFNPKYHLYGGRGIQVDPRWRWSYKNFWLDMGMRPSDEYSLEREDNDGDYTPSNCKWATQVEQIRNRRETLQVTIGGISKPLAVWAEEVGLSMSTVLVRRFRHPNDPVKWLKPIQQKGRRL